MDVELIEHDEVIDRAVRALLALPLVPAHATARVMAAVRNQPSTVASRFTLALRWVRQPSLSVLNTSVLAAATLVLGFFGRGAFRTAMDNASIGTSGSHTNEYPVASGTTFQPAASTNEVRAVPVSLVFVARNAKTVAIVGDFNSWNENAAPMQRLGVGGPWTGLIAARPGRHTYAFLVDGTTLVADPRAPRARDLDFGGDASVLMVMTP